MDLDLHRKEIYGVQLSRREELMEFTHREFQRIFGDTIILKRKQSVPDMMDWFEVEYEYKPKNFRMVLECWMKTFDITIYDYEGAFTSLSQICPSGVKHDDSEKSISEAIKKLYDILRSEEELIFYISNGRKLFEKRNGKTKRIR